MPSPFPGMDPYLEGAEWMSFHGQFIAEIARQLAPHLRPRYRALMQKRFVIDLPDPDEGLTVSAATARPGDVYPDVAVEESASSGGGMGTASVVAAPLQLETVMPSNVPVHWVEVRDVAERRLVTVIELLSPSNRCV